MDVRIASREKKSVVPAIASENITTTIDPAAAKGENTAEIADATREKNITKKEKSAHAEEDAGIRRID